MTELFNFLNGPSVPRSPTVCLKNVSVVSSLLPVCMRFLSEESKEAEKRSKARNIMTITMLIISNTKLIVSVYVWMCVRDLTKPACSKSV